MKIFKLFLFIVMFLMLIPIAFAPGENDTKVLLAWYNDNSTAAGERPARSDLWTGQGFYVGNQTDNKNYNLSHVTLWIRKDSSPTLDLDVCIDTFDSGNPQVPKSKQIICNLTVESTVAIQGYFRPYNISIRQADGSLYELNASKNYAIIANGSDSGSPNQYVLQSREADSYLNESAYQTLSPPGSWSKVGTRDILFEVWVFNGSASTPDTTFPIVNVSINNTSPKYGEWLNITANITDETGLSTANITYNMSGVLTKANYTLSGTTASISNLTNITCTRGCVINFTVYATDTSNNVKQNSTLITVANTAPLPPTINQPALNTLYNKQPLDMNITIINDIDADAITEIKWWINGTLNQTTGASNTTLNISDGKYNLSVAVYDGLDYSSNSTVLSFKVDTINPTTNLTTALPNLTYITFDRNISILASDANLFGHNVTCWQGDDIAGVMKFSLEKINISNNSLSNTITLTINTSWGDGRYTCISNASDDHTAKQIPNYTTSKDIATSTINFGTGKDFITVKLKSSDIGLLDFYTFKQDDRYVFVFNFSNTSVTDAVHSYTFKTSSNYPLIYRSDSDIPSLLVAKDNWIDYKLKSNYSATYSVKEAPIDSGKFETTIQTQETTLIFESIGGVNRVGQRTQIQIDADKPAFFSRQPLNNTEIKSSLIQINITIVDSNNASAYLQGNFSGTFKINETRGYTNNTKLSFTALNLSDGVYLYSIFANDSAGSFNTTDNFTFTINTSTDTTAPFVTLLSPANNSAIYNTGTLQFLWNVNETSSCSLMMQNRILASHSSIINNVTSNFTTDIIGNNLEWLVNCTDSSNNNANSTFIISLLQIVAGTGSTGGGGGGGSFTVAELYKAVTSNSSNINNNITYKQLNDTSYLLTKNEQTFLVTTKTNLTMDGWLYTLIIPLSFTLDYKSIEASNFLKHFLAMEYSSNEPFSSIKVTGIRPLPILLIPTSLFVLIIFFRVSKLLGKAISKLS